MEQVQRTEVIPVSGRELFADASKLADNVLRNKRETKRLENQQGLKEPQAENILTNRHKEIIIKNNQKQSKIITNCQKSSNFNTNYLKSSKDEVNQNNKEHHNDRTGTHTQENSALFTAGNNTDTNKPTITTQSSGTNPAKPDRTNNIPDRTKPGFTIDFEPIRRNLAKLDHCVQQLKSLAAIFANIPKKQIKNKEISR